MIYRCFHFFTWFLLLSVLLGVSAAGNASAQTLDQPVLGNPADSGAEATDNPKKLRQSLDVVISTLESDKQRQALLEKLKTLRDRTNTKHDKAAKKGGSSHGVLGALTDSFNELSHRVAIRDTVFDVRTRIATSDLRKLFHSMSRAELQSSLLRIAIWLTVWIALLILIVRAGHMLFERRGWPLILPPEPRPWILVAHFLRRMMPAFLTFSALFITMRFLDTSATAIDIVLVVAYAALCARLLTTVVDVVVSLFSVGHRRVAVALLHRKALKPLFAIGALVAIGDAVNSEPLSDILGSGLSTWLTEMINLTAAVISGWLVLRVRRPMQHLIRNRPYSQRRNFSAKRELTVLLANLWYIPALLVIAASILAILLTGGDAQIAFSRAVVCSVLVVLALVLSGLLRRQREKAMRRVYKSRYVQRLSRFGYTLVFGLVWLVTAEFCAHVWGESFLGGGDSSALSPQIGRALMAAALTALLAWLFWIVADTALDVALNGGRRRRGKGTARSQTVMPILRATLFVIIVVIATIAALANLGVNVTPLLAGAGIIGLAVGFGAQNLVQDLITGIFILVEDSLAVGDFVDINTHMGTVEGLNLRTVRLRDLDGILHFITFSHITSIHNMSRQFGIALLKIRVPHDLPIDEAITLMRETDAELRKDWRMARLLRSPLEMQGIHAFEDGCPILRMRMRTVPEYQWDVGRAFNLLLKRRMEAHYVNPGAPRISVRMEAGETSEEAKGRFSGNE